MKTSSGERDLRIDLVRGTALLVLVTDHLPGNPLRIFLPVSWGLADMAEAFVLLSGVVFGIGVLKTRSASQEMSGRLRRCFRIYFAYLITGLLVILLVRHFHIGVLAKTFPPHLLAEPFLAVLRDVAIVNGRITHLSILLLYFWLALVTLCLPRKIWQAPCTVLGLSLVLYLGTQFFPTIALPEQLQSATYYNPFAWQFLFVIGTVFSIAGPTSKQSLCSQRWLFPFALVVQGGLLFYVGMEFHLPVSLTFKSNLGPLRLLHALSTAVILRELLPGEWSRLGKRICTPILLCSEQSLWVYCGGTLTAVMLTQHMWNAESLFEVVMINFLVWSACLGIGWVITKMKSFVYDKRRGSPGRDGAMEKTGTVERLS